MHAHPAPPQKFTGSARAKLLICGEHAVFHGSPAVGITLPLSIEITCHPTPAPALHLDPSTRTALGPAAAPEYEKQLLPHLQAAFQTANLPHRGAELTIQGTIPIGAGLGSSAALCGATAQVIAHIRQHAPAPPTDAETWRLAHQLERIFHGNPSGVDSLLTLRDSTQNALTVLAPGTTPHPQQEHTQTPLRPLPAGTALIDYNLLLHIIVLPREQTSAALIAHIHQLQTDPRYRPHIDNLVNLCTECADFFMQSDPTPAPALSADLPGLCTKMHAELTALGISTAKIDSILEFARTRTGARGGKMSGAGGGGALFVLYNDPHTWQHSARPLYEYTRTQSPQARMFSGNIAAGEWKEFTEHTP